MGRLVFHFRDRELQFTFEGSIAEAAELIRELTDERDSVPRAEAVVKQAERIVEEISNAGYRPRARLVTAKDLRKYILSKPHYEHTFTEIMEHFLGQRLSVMNRSEEGRYKNLSRKLGLLRREIAREQNGDFSEEWVMTTDSKGKSFRTKVHVFKPRGMSELAAYATGGTTSR